MSGRLAGGSPPAAEGPHDARAMAGGLGRVGAPAGPDAAGAPPVAGSAALGADRGGAGRWAGRPRAVGDPAGPPPVGPRRRPVGLGDSRAPGASSDPTAADRRGPGRGGADRSGVDLRPARADVAGSADRPSTQPGEPDRRRVDIPGHRSPGRPVPPGSAPGRPLRGRADPVHDAAPVDPPVPGDAPWVGPPPHGARTPVGDRSERRAPVPSASSAVERADPSGRPCPDGETVDRRRGRAWGDAG